MQIQIVHGEYLYSRFDELENTVNSILDGGSLELEDITDLLLYNEYKDLQKAFHGNQQKLWEHLCEYGINEGRLFSYVYQPQYYKAKYKDLQDAFKDNWWDYVNHFEAYAMKENRVGNKIFDIAYYKEHNPDIKSFTNVDALKHFLRFGINEWRETSPEFNVKVYRDNNKDLQKAFKKNCKDYYKHFLIYGQYENRVVK